MHLKGRTAVVSGSTRGIGRAIVLRLAQEGANIVFNYLNNEQIADDLKREIESFGVSASSFKVDVRDYEQVQKMKELVLDQFGTFDILINNAGITKDSALVMMNKNDWLDVIDTNLNGTFNMTKAAIGTFMKQKRGDIINIASISGVTGMARQCNYASSKGGMIAFTKSLAKEVAAFNVRVNAIAPGFIETDMTGNLKEDYRNKMKALIPLGRFGRPEEVAETVNFLLLERSHYITGQVIQIDGGLGI